MEMNQDNPPFLRSYNIQTPSGTYRRNLNHLIYINIIEINMCIENSKNNHLICLYIEQKVYTLIR